MGGIIPMVDRLNQLADSRSDIHVTYPLAEVLFIVYASILSGHNKWTRMEKFAKKTSDGFVNFSLIDGECPLITPLEKYAS